MSFVSLALWLGRPMHYARRERALNIEVAARRAPVEVDGAFVLAKTRQFVVVTATIGVVFAT
eukprot:8961876-Lingulodinium_polyedra.AAC.1